MKEISSIKKVNEWLTDSTRKRKKQRDDDKYHIGPTKEMAEEIWKICFKNLHLQYDNKER